MEKECRKEERTKKMEKIYCGTIHKHNHILSNAIKLQQDPHTQLLTTVNLGVCTAYIST